MVVAFFVLIFATLSVLMCWQESMRREISFGMALIYCLLLTPIIGYIVILHRPFRDQFSCRYCGSGGINVDGICSRCGKDNDADSKDEKHLILE